MKKTLVFLVAGISFSGFAGEKAVPGEPAPPLNLEMLLQAPAGTVASRDVLKGKVVVLEFWASGAGRASKRCRT